MDGWMLCPDSSISRCSPGFWHDMMLVGLVGLVWLVGWLIGWNLDGWMDGWLVVYGGRRIGLPHRPLHFITQGWTSKTYLRHCCAPNTRRNAAAIFGRLGAVIPESLSFMHKFASY